MDYGIVKIIGSSKSLLLWAYALFADQTRITIMGQQNPELETNTLLIKSHIEADGLLMFGVSTESKDKIEIKRIEVEYAALAKFADPNNTGFFSFEKSNNINYPFRLFWSGSAFLEKNVTQVFALAVKAENKSHEQSVRINVHAQRHKAGLGGFSSVGRLHLTSFVKTIAFTNKNIGFKVPPAGSMTSEQPFIIQGPVTASQGGTIMVHESLGNGEHSSRQINT